MLRVISAFSLFMLAVPATQASANGRPKKPAASKPAPARKSARAPRVQPKTSKPKGVAKLLALFSRKNKKAENRRRGSKTSGLSFRIEKGTPLSFTKARSGLKTSSLELGERDVIVVGRRKSGAETGVFQAASQEQRSDDTRLEAQISRKHLTIAKGADGSLEITNGVEQEGKLVAPSNGTEINTKATGPVAKAKFRMMKAKEKYVVKPGQKVWVRFPSGTVLQLEAAK